MKGIEITEYEHVNNAIPFINYVTATSLNEKTFASSIKYLECSKSPQDKCIAISFTESVNCYIEKK